MLRQRCRFRYRSSSDESSSGAEKPRSGRTGRRRLRETHVPQHPGSPSSKLPRDTSQRDAVSGWIQTIKEEAIGRGPTEKHGGRLKRKLGSVVYPHTHVVVTKMPKEEWMASLFVQKATTSLVLEVRDASSYRDALKENSDKGFDSESVPTPNSPLTSDDKHSIPFPIQASERPIDRRLIHPSTLRTVMNHARVPTPSTLLPVAATTAILLGLDRSDSQKRRSSIRRSSKLSAIEDGKGINVVHDIVVDNQERPLLSRCIFNGQKIRFTTARTKCDIGIPKCCTLEPGSLAALQSSSSLQQLRKNHEEKNQQPMEQDQTCLYCHRPLDQFQLHVHDWQRSAVPQFLAPSAFIYFGTPDLQTSEN